MRTIGIAAAAVAAAALVLALAGLSAGSKSGRHPSLRLVRTAPLQLVGAHFRARERVRLTVTVSAARRTRAVRASDRGLFLARFGISAGHCSALRAVAVGNAGSRAVLKPLPMPACMPQ
jgi:hypothetical protein